jgi:hypothetical protein
MSSDEMQISLPLCFLPKDSSTCNEIISGNSDSEKVDQDDISTIKIYTFLHGRGYFAGLRVTKRNKATVLLTLTPNLTLLQVCFQTNLDEKSFDEMSF